MMNLVNYPYLILIAMRTHVIETKDKIGEKVELFGWVNGRRDHGKIIFIDLRDQSGLVQIVFTPSDGAMYEIANKLRSEWVIRVVGEVSKRPEKMINSEIPTGQIEIQPRELEVISQAENLPFEIDKDTLPVNEDVRMRYRYLDLRSERMQHNILLRHQVVTLIREFLNKNNFVEIETPLLTKTSPEGARDFLVPSRLQPGKFYALPQSPQQYKQLLMLAGFERYYQIAKALRDEDLRGDRQLEHSQIDMEMSFMNEQEVRSLVEEMIIYVTEGCGKKIFKKPFPQFTHEQAMKEFGADKFDARGDNKDPNVLAFAWVTGFPLFEWNEEEKKYTFAHNPFSAPKKEHLEKLMNEEDLGSLRAQQYDLVCNGYELASGGVRISDPKVQEKVFSIMGLNHEETQERFGHLTNAYRYGAPFHAGIAAGIDRLIMILANQPSIREVIAFPVNSSGQTSVMDAPSPASARQLKELHIKLDK